MADIFISYKREERAEVETLAKALRDLSFEVWFDARLTAGEGFSAEIDREAREAKAMVVCWSPNARASRWVIAEAQIGFEQDKLAAAYVSGPNEFSPPVPFNTIQSEDLRAWLAQPDVAHSAWRSLLRRLGKLCGRADVESFGALDAQASTSTLNEWLATHAESPLFVAVESLVHTRRVQDEERAQLERAARERQAAAAARDAEQAAARQRETEALAARQREAETALARRREQERAEAETQRHAQAAKFGKRIRLAVMVAAGVAALLIGGWAVSASLSLFRAPPETPPEFVRTDACPLQGCVLGEWRARTDLSLYERPSDNSPVVGTIPAGAVVRALQGEEHLSGLRGRVMRTVGRFHQGDVVYRGWRRDDGSYTLSHHGEVVETDPRLWSDACAPSQRRGENCGLVFGDFAEADALAEVWWVYVQGGDGVAGWARALQNFDGQTASPPAATSPPRQSAPREPPRPQPERQNASTTTATTQPSGPLSLGPPPPTREQETSSSAQPEPSMPTSTATTTIPAVQWAQRPSARRISDLYPSLALRGGVAGRVELDCVVQPDLSIACTIARETPTGYFFGRAALSAATNYRARPQLTNGASAVGQQTRIAIQFVAPQ